MQRQKNWYRRRSSRFAVDLGAIEVVWVVDEVNRDAASALRPMHGHVAPAARQVHPDAPPALAPGLLERARVAGRYDVDVVADLSQPAGKRGGDVREAAYLREGVDLCGGEQDTHSAVPRALRLASGRQG